MYSIRTKLIALFALITSLFVASLLGITYLNERDRVLNIELEHSIALSELHAKLVSREIQGYASLLKAIANDARVAKGEKRYIVSELNKVMELGKGAFHNAIYVDRNYKAIDFQGNAHSIADRNFVKDQRWRTSEYNVTPPHVGRFKGKPVISIGVPLLGKDGSWQGAISAVISIEYLNQRLSSIKMRQGSYAWLSGEDGMVISHPVEQLIMNAYVHRGDEVGFPGFSEIGEKTFEQDVGYGEYFDTNKDKSKIVTFAKIEALPGWTLFITTEKAEVFKDIYSIALDILVTSAILMILFWILVIKFTQELTRPIVELTRQVKNSVNNRYKPIEVVASNDEIGQLSRAFCETINQVNEHTNTLEERVRTRTQELNDANDKLENSNRQLEKNNRVLQDAALKDPLTELYNRRAFNGFAEKEMSVAERHVLQTSLILIDIDHFKKINDVYGHDVGDDVLTQMAKLLSKYTRKENIVCRWGGEEFVILLPQANAEMAMCAMTALQQKIKQATFGPIKNLTVSAGIATFKIGEPLQSWVGRADVALYAAKADGRDCFKLSVENQRANRSLDLKVLEKTESQTQS
ncbi:diguanylate cyclase [Vibrio sp. SCSIO 43136]|uniref:sensor domain-containing diguanylate cyclase n=1 Tax=Vibrio sp. SCSIO 43136 TaxID=2819101 RepID=UPI00207517BC|nr:diguanylate cyclase [Vibrio sp. SCSIO 43136]USD66921.1 diguanylate cyclase [Vibrio sp. SCSIO 43136]